MSPQNAEKTPEDLRAQLEELRAKTKASEDLLTAAMDEVEAKKTREALGLDLDFDINALITEGVIEKRGIKIAEKVFVDLKTLTKADDILSERLVAEIYAETPLVGGALAKARDTAKLALAVSRINNTRFPSPSATSIGIDDEWKHNWDLKKVLFQALLRLPETYTMSLTIIYNNLEQADILIDESLRKKS